MYNKDKIKQGEIEMGFRFRKSINLGGLRLNLSKSGLGYSVGTTGYRITKSATGKTYRTMSIPNTGLSHVKYFNELKTKTKSINWLTVCKWLIWFPIKYMFISIYFISVFGILISLKLFNLLFLGGKK